jgi:hypothetical protein
VREAKTEPRGFWFPDEKRKKKKLNNCEAEKQSFAPLPMYTLIAGV